MADGLERFDPELRGRISYEHHHRYAICKEFVAGKRALDIACGDGYGSAVLAETAAEVVGVDISAETVSSARAKYLDRPRLSFVEGDCRHLPFADGEFDVVVSFETIEHITAQEDFILEVRRVLRPGGVFIVSTPNQPVYALESKEPNPFHEKELSRDEFEALLKSHFRHVSINGQRFHIASVIGPEANAIEQSAEASYHGYAIDESRAIVSGTVGLRTPMYFLAFCGDSEVNFPVGDVSLLIDPSDDLWLEYRSIMQWASRLHDEDEALRERLKQSEESLLALRGDHERGSSDLETSRARSALLESEIATMTAALTRKGRAAEQALGAMHRLEDLLKDHASTLGEIEGVESNSIETFLSSGSRKIAEQNARIKAMNAEVAEFAETINHLKGNLSAASARCASLDMEVARLAALVHERDGTIDQILGSQQGDENFFSAYRKKYNETVGENTQSTTEFLESISARVGAQASHIEKLERKFAGTSSTDTVADRNTSAHGLEMASYALQVRHALAAAGRSEKGSSPQPLGFFERFSARALVRNSGLFDSAWYASRIKSSTNGKNLVDYYLKVGVQNGHSPNPLFSPTWYSSEAGKALPAHARAFLHYLSDGRKAGISPHPFFDPGFYLERNPDIPKSVDPLKHFLDVGDAEGRQAHPLIVPEFVRLQMAPDDRSGPVTLRYLTDPKFFQLMPHPLFNGARYLITNPDVAVGGLNPLLHYLERGWLEGRSPHEFFENDFYLATQPDVLAARLNPLAHFVREGARQGRWPHPYFDMNYYVRGNPHVRDFCFDPLSHFALLGQQAGLKPSAGVDLGIFANARSTGPCRYFGQADLDEMNRVRHMAIASRIVDSPAPKALALTEPGARNGLPPALHALATSRYGADEVAYLTKIMGLVSLFGDAPDAFAKSLEIESLVEHLKTKAAGRSTDNVDVSIIIPVYNNLVYTLTAIASVLDRPSRFTYEIIVGDDGSTDRTPEVIERIGGNVRLVRHPSNLGFLGNCNAAAARSGGRFLLFLNNDTICLPGWLDENLGTFELDPSIGLVGSKLINADGTLQEAGGIFWRDGSAWNYGRDQDAGLSEFNYMKDADYCSGASISTPRVVWDRLQGFDMEFAPAYCEDSDFAFRVRAAGWRAVYQPLSELIHHEGRSHGRDVSSGIKAYQVRNQERLKRRWKAELEANNFPNGEQVHLARDRSRSKPHILFIDHYVPQWDRDAGSRTIYQYIRMFIDSGFHVAFWPDNLHEDKEYVRPLQRLGVEVIYGPRFVGRFAAWWLSVQEDYKYAFVCRPHVAAKYMDVLKASKHVKVAYYGVDLHFQRLRRQFDLEGDQALLREMDRIKPIELKICRDSDLVMYPSQEELDIVQSEIGADKAGAALPITIFTEPEIVESERNLDKIARNDPYRLMFVGGFTHTPNVDGVVWFVSEVMPLLRARDSRFTLSIAGSNPPAEISSLAAADVRLLGRVSDAELQELYDNSGMSVAPLRYGSGVKGKVIEALGKGVPIVTTTIGVQGIPGAEAMAGLGDNPADFAEAVIAVATDRALALERARAGLAFIRDHYSLVAVKRIFKQFFREL